MGVSGLVPGLEAPATWFDEPWFKDCAPVCAVGMWATEGACVLPLQLLVYLRSRPTRVLTRRVKWCPKWRGSDTLVY